MTDRITLDHFRYALAVGEGGAFSAAARMCGVSQPTMSNAIARLEDQLAEPLFTRSARGTLTTEFGAKLLPLMAAAVSAFDAVVAASVRWQEAERDVVRVGVSPLISPDLVALLYRSVREIGRPYGPYGLVLREANLDDLRAALAASEIDVAIIPAVAPMARHEHRIVAAEPLVLIESTTMTAEPVALQQLSGTQFILMPDTCGLTTFTRSLLNDASLSHRTYPGEASSYRVLAEWSRLGLGSALLPLSKVGEPSQGRAVVDEEGQPVEIFYEAVWNPASPLATELAMLADELSSFGHP